MGYLKTQSRRRMTSRVNIVNEARHPTTIGTKDSKFPGAYLSGENSELGNGRSRWETGQTTNRTKGEPKPKDYRANEANAFCLLEYSRQDLNLRPAD